MPQVTGVDHGEHRRTAKSIKILASRHGWASWNRSSKRTALVSESCTGQLHERALVGSKYRVVIRKNNSHLDGHKVTSVSQICMTGGL